jgi:hypothetical protein
MHFGLESEQEKLSVTSYEHHDVTYSCRVASIGLEAWPSMNLLEDAAASYLYSSHSKTSSNALTYQ